MIEQSSPDTNNEGVTTRRSSRKKFKNEDKT